MQQKNRENVGLYAINLYRNRVMSPKNQTRDGEKKEPKYKKKRVRYYGIWTC